MKVVIIVDKSGLKHFRNTYQLFTDSWSEVYVQCPEEVVKEISQVVPKERIWTEPFRRGTAAAVGLATARIAAKESHEQALFVFANQIVSYKEKLINTLKLAMQAQSQIGRMVLIGVSITKQTDEYGYIQIGKVIQETEGLLTFELTDFDRNPSLEKLAMMKNSWRYLWDTGYMLCEAEELLGIYRQVNPDLFSGLMTIKAAIGTKFAEEIVGTVYEKLERLPLSVMIYEKVNHQLVGVIPVDIGRIKNE